MNYRTCRHAYDNGNLCQSAAVTGRDYCCYHLRHRGLRMRITQARARAERCDLQLPPLENMHAVQSALTQLMEAVVADMIDLKHAQFLLSGLRFAANNFKKPEAWRASEYQNDGSAPSKASHDEFESEFGLPQDLDLDTPPEVAFPPPEPLSGGGPQLPDVGNCGEMAPSIAASDFSGPVPQLDFPVTAVDIELNELQRTEGPRAMIKRADEIERNRFRREKRRLAREAYERYSVLAYNRNIQLTAEKMVAEKLAADRAATQNTEPETPCTKKPPTPVTPEAKPTEARSTA